MAININNTITYDEWSSRIRSHVIKYDEHGVPLRYKARIVAKGFAQVEGVHFTETYAPTAKFTSIRTVLAMTVTMNLKLHQMDVTTAFLYAPIDAEIYVSQPEGHEVKGKEDFVWKLKKALYGLKQSPHLWNQVLNGFLKSQGFTQTNADACVYIQ